MKKILLLVIAAILLIVGFVSSQHAPKAPQPQKADAGGALEYVNATLPRMITDWDETAWINNLNITEKSFWNTKQGKSALAMMVRNYSSQLGRMTNLESTKPAPAETGPTEAEGPAKISASGESVFNIKEKYVANASFERGKANFTVAVGKTTGAWKIEQITIQIVRDITPPPPSTSNQ